MRLLIFIFLFTVTAFSQIPAIEPGVSQELAKWRASHYSNISYKLNLTLEKMSPVLKGTIEIRVTVSEPPASAGGQKVSADSVPIILDWQKIKGHEGLSQISSILLNGSELLYVDPTSMLIDNPDPPVPYLAIYERNEHLVFRNGVVFGENVIKLDFTSPILTSGGAITRYVDKEDGAEYIYSLFVPSDASTAFPVFDQPDLKARFSLEVMAPWDWKVMSNSQVRYYVTKTNRSTGGKDSYGFDFAETLPISTYVFAFAAGPFAQFDEQEVFAEDYFQKQSQRAETTKSSSQPIRPHSKEKTSLQKLQETFGYKEEESISSVMDVVESPPVNQINVRKSQAAKFKPHAAEVFRLNREAVKYLETYFDYKFPFPKYDLVLIPEFPFGGMEHAGATFLREQSVIFPQEPTKNDIVTRANLIFHEAAHQWFGDTVTMKWFDDLWLKEGFAEFMAYKTLEKIMPEANAWKVFYERNKQAAYATDSTKGTTPIYQPIANLNSAKSAYGNIVYRKAPSFLRQAEFYFGEKIFQKAVRNFLHRNAFKNAEWTDLVREFEKSSGQQLWQWANAWVTKRGLAVNTLSYGGNMFAMTTTGCIVSTTLNGEIRSLPDPDAVWPMKTKVLIRHWAEVWRGKDRATERELRTSLETADVGTFVDVESPIYNASDIDLIFPNYEDYGYGIFLLDDKSRDYVLKNIQNEKDDFLRTMMWGSLWDSVREAELAPKDYVELVIKNLGGEAPDVKARTSVRAVHERSPIETDETIIASILARVTVALNYYIPAPDTALTNVRASATDDLRSRLEAVLIEKIQNASTQGQRITYYRAFLNIASTDNARRALKQILKDGSAASAKIALKTKDKFDIVTRLAILGDPDAPALLAYLEKTEASDDAKRYAYAAHAAFGTVENKQQFFLDFIGGGVSESWIESAIIPFNSLPQADLTQRYLGPAIMNLPELKRKRKIFFVNNWLAAFIGGQRDQNALNIINMVLAANPDLDNDLRLRILENSDTIERAIKIRAKYKN